jgi:hypothetical protein
MTACFQARTRCPEADSETSSHSPYSIALEKPTRPLVTTWFGHPASQRPQADLRFATIERIAVQAVVAFEGARGCKVESVEGDTRGFDLISRRVLSKTEGDRVATRFIEVKGRAAVGEIALTANEYKAALRLGDDYWLYVVFNCGSQPQVTTIQNPARFDWEALSKIDCYRLGSETILESQS